MRVAVCVSGTLKSTPEQTKRNVHVMKRKFPKADFFFATWDSNAKMFSDVFPNERCFVFQEPEMHYHPFSTQIAVPDDVKIHYHKSISRMSIEEGRLEWLRNSTKQILIHAMLINEIKDHYDVIVRTRFDAHIWKHPKVNFNSLVAECYKKDLVYGFMSDQPKQYLCTLRGGMEKKDQKFNYRLCDFLIIHPRRKIDYHRVMHLHNTRKLRGGEYGWYQVLSEPFTSKHKNFLGWVTKDDITSFNDQVLAAESHLLTSHQISV